MRTQAWFVKKTSRSLYSLLMFFIIVLFVVRHRVYVSRVRDVHHDFCLLSISNLPKPEGVTNLQPTYDGKIFILDGSDMD